MDYSDIIVGIDIVILCFYIFGIQVNVLRELQSITSSHICAEIV